MNKLTEEKKKRISDLLCNAFEGGSNYWYEIKGYKYPEGKTKEDFEFQHIEVPITEDGAIIVGTLKNDDGSYDMPEKELNLKACLKGLRVMRNLYPRHYADWLIENDDATTADVYLQCCLYGQLIFG